MKGKVNNHEIAENKGIWLPQLFTWLLVPHTDCSHSHTTGLLVCLCSCHFWNSFPPTCYIYRMKAFSFKTVLSTGHPPQPQLGNVQPGTLPGRSLHRKLMEFQTPGGLAYNTDTVPGGFGGVWRFLKWCSRGEEGLLWSDRPGSMETLDRNLPLPYCLYQTSHLKKLYTLNLILR